jgi:hypothetical protein
LCNGLGGIAVKFGRLRAAAIGGAFAILNLFAGAPAATAATFDFAAAYNATTSIVIGNTSNLTDYSAGLINGQIIHGTFSYDPTLAPTSTASNSQFDQANYLATISFSLPSLTVPTSAASAFVIDGKAGFADVFAVAVNMPAPVAPTNHFFAEGASLSLTAATDSLFNSTALPTSFDLADFLRASLFISQYARMRFVVLVDKRPSLCFVLIMVHAVLRLTPSAFAC